VAIELNISTKVPQRKRKQFVPLTPPILYSHSRRGTHNFWRIEICLHFEFKIVRLHEWIKIPMGAIRIPGKKRKWTQDMKLSSRTQAKYFYALRWVGIVLWTLILWLLHICHVCPRGGDSGKASHPVFPTFRFGLTAAAPLSINPFDIEFTWYRRSCSHWLKSRLECWKLETTPHSSFKPKTFV